MSWESRVRQNAAEILWEAGCVRLGEFKLHSGAVSPIYVDCRMLFSNPSLFRELCSMLCDLIEQARPAKPDPACIVGVETSGIAWAAVIAQSLHWPMCYARKSLKDHGLGKIIEGSPSKQCALVDDVITTGITATPPRQALEKDGFNIFAHAVILDRRPRQEGWQVKSLTDMTAVLEHAPQKEQKGLWQWWQDEVSKQGA